jgi:hypothetical protein
MYTDKKELLPDTRTEKSGSQESRKKILLSFMASWFPDQKFFSVF